uniref:ANK_REP_REGION domain-containing protein n=1 Tax=Anopheles maculatus TaxID=74869 RepID=A0A182T0D7_9DIPT
TVESLALPERLRDQTLVDDLLRVTKQFEYCLSPADVNSDSFTPLHHARDECAIENYLQFFEIDVASPRFRTTPLHLACLCDEPARVKTLLKHGANPMLANGEGWTPLLLAVSNRSIAIVKTLLQHNTFNSQPTDREDLNAVLAIAIRKQSIDIANLLLEKGASIDTIGKTLTALSPTHRGSSKHHQPQHPHQLFFCAAREGYNRILEYLLDSALFDVNTKDTIGSTALFHALSRAPLSTLDILVRHGADVEHCNQFGHNVLSIAVMNNRLDALQYFVNNFPTLVERFLDAVEADTKNSVLHLAVLRGALDIVQYCVKLHRAGDVSLDAQNKEGFTALHISAQTGHEAIFGYLLSHGANTTIPSSNGQSILHT